MLKLREVAKSFVDPQGGRAEVLRDVSLDLAAGQSLALTGASGSGKSTLLHVIAGLEVADKGDVSVDGQSLTGLSDRALSRLRRERIALVFQQFNLIGSLNIRDNIAFQARLSGRFDTDWTNTITARLGLDPFLDMYPEQLSGGQQQRVAIARALAPRPGLLLADEPTGNLDEANAAIVLDLMLSLVAQTQAACLMVTHSADLAAQLDQTRILKAGHLL